MHHHGATMIHKVHSNDGSEYFRPGITQMHLIQISYSISCYTIQYTIDQPCVRPSLTELVKNLVEHDSFYININLYHRIKQNKKKQFLMPFVIKINLLCKNNIRKWF